MMLFIANIKDLLKLAEKHPVLLILFIVCMIASFILALKSRKYYKCPECGESFRAEHLTADSCKVCGAKLQETNDKNVNDKAI